MDYAFVPYTDAYCKANRRLYILKQGVTLLLKDSNNEKIKSLSSFILETMIKASALPDRRIKCYYSVSHANRRGFFQMWLTDDIPNSKPLKHLRAMGVFYYEYLKDLGSDIEILDDYMFFDVEGNCKSFFHIKGCCIGQSVKTLRLFKKKLGNKINVTAPLHYHLVYNITSSGEIEYFGHDFTITSKTPYKTRDDLINAFDGRGFKFIDGTTQVPLAFWKKWIPANKYINYKKKYKRRYLSVDLPINIANKNRYIIPHKKAIEYRHVKLRWNQNLKFSELSIVTSDSKEQKLEKFKTWLSNQDFMKKDETNPDNYPVFERCGHETFDEFFDSFTWNLPKSKKNDVLEVRGVRHEYTLLFPIERPTGEDLYYNFYYNNTSKNPIIEVTEDNEAFFTAV